MLIILPTCPIDALLYVSHVRLCMTIDFPFVCFLDANRFNIMSVVLFAVIIVLS